MLNVVHLQCESTQFKKSNRGLSPIIILKRDSKYEADKKLD